MNGQFCITRDDSDATPVESTHIDGLSRVMEKLDEVRDFVLQRTDVKHQFGEQLDDVARLLDANQVPKLDRLSERVDALAMRASTRARQLDELRGAHVQTTAERDRAVRDAAELRKLLDEVTAQREAAIVDRDAARAEVEAWRSAAATGLPARGAMAPVELTVRIADLMADLESTRQVVAAVRRLAAEATAVNEELANKRDRAVAVGDLLAESLAGAVAINEQIANDRDVLRAELDRERSMRDVYGRTMGRLLRRIGLR